MAKTHNCLFLICLIRQLLCCDDSLSSKKLDHVTVKINTFETFPNGNETVELSVVAVHDQSLFQGLGKIVDPTRIASERKVSDGRDEEDCGSSAESRSADSPDMTPAEEDGRKIAEAKDRASLTENSAGCVEGKCNISRERSWRVYSISRDVLSSGEANRDEAELVALETPATTAPLPPPTDSKPHRTQVGSGPIAGDQVLHAHQKIQALKTFDDDGVTGRENSCPLQLVILFLGLCISRIEF